MSRSNGLNYDHLSMTFSDVKRFAVGFLWLPLLGGCATQTDEQSRQLRELTDRLARMQSTTDRLEERVSALETVHRTQSVKQVQTGNSAGVPADLPVVKMAPPTSAIPSEGIAGVNSESEEPRTLIVGEGSRVEARSGAQESSPSNPLPKRSKDKATESTTKKPGGTTETGKKTP